LRPVGGLALASAAGQGSAMLRACATDPAASRGRRYPEAASLTRDAFQRDRDRIVHCSAFRRLRDKTQVFVRPDGDHFRVRLTHSLEVAQIARAVARALGLNEDLTEACALAHDLGHPPFGHSGEDALECAMAPFGGFDHNAQTVRIVTRLEQRYPGFDGLNLSWETIEGLAKHNGPVTAVPWALAEADAEFALDLGTWPGLEAQVAAAADDIAYDNHDLDDGLRAGLFDIDDVLAVPFVADCWGAVTARFPHVVARRRLVPELVREQIGRMVTTCSSPAARGSPPPPRNRSAMSAPRGTRWSASRPRWRRQPQRSRHSCGRGCTPTPRSPASAIPRSKSSPGCSPRSTPIRRRCRHGGATRCPVPSPSARGTSATSSPG
jgi:putative nucleotidyltransferase with HDIG domain